MDFIKFLENVIYRPEALGENPGQRSRIFMMACSVTLIGLSAFLIYYGLLDPSYNIAPMAVLFLVIILSLIINQQGFTNLAANLLVWSTLIGLFSLALANDGLYDTALQAIPALLIVAAMLLKRRVLIILSILSILSMILMGTLQYAQIILVAERPKKSITDLFDLVVIDGATIILVLLISSYLRGSLRLAKHAEGRLDESEERFRTLLQHGPDGFEVVDQEGRFLEVNPATIRQLGYTRDEMMKLTIFDIDPLITWDQFEQLKPLILSSNSRRLESLHRRKDGSTFPVELSIAAIRLDGRLHFLAEARDITERKNNDEAVKRINDRFISLADNIPGHVAYVNATTLQYEFINAAFEKSFGIPRQKIIGSHVKDIIGESNYRFALKYINQVRLGESVSYENTFQLVSGKRWIQVNYTPIFGTDGQVTSIVVLSVDITKLKQAEEALRESERHLRSVITAAPIALWDLDPEGNILLSEGNALPPLGLKSGELVGQCVFEFYKHDPEALALIRRGLAGEEFSAEVNVGGRHWNNHYVPRRDEKEKVIGLIGISVDVTELKRAEEEKQNLKDRLQRAEKMEALGQLAGGVAHDLNNVLGMLIGYSELLLNELSEGHPHRGYAEKIFQSTEKGAAIIEDLLTLARRGVPVAEVTNLNSIVMGFLKTAAFDRIKEHHPLVFIFAECDPNLPNIKGSPVHLEKTLMNLICNAAEAISGHGTITIRTENRSLDGSVRGDDEVKQGDYAVLTVTDTGMGIPAENIERIFEPFYTKKAMGRSGTGLGLAIVWGTVKDHHGYIDVRTEIGKGTTFALYFPVTREELIPTPQKRPIEQYIGHGESVLIVDDIAEQREVATRLLNRLGYRTQTASSGEAAVEYLRKNRSDIIVMELIMSIGLDGLETYRRILEIHPKQKAILVSGFFKTDQIEEALRLGAGACLKRPYILEQIGLAIREELNRLV